LASGSLSTRTLNIVPSNDTQGSQAGNSTASTQTKATSAFVAVINASSPVVTATTSSLSTGSASSLASTSTASSSSSYGGYQVTVIVRGTTGQAISGARVTLDGGTTQSTPTNGTVFFLGIPQGEHHFVITSGAWSTSILYIAQGNPSVRLFVDVPGQ
jgi:hypothetical protein